MTGILEMDLNRQIYFYFVLCANVYSAQEFVNLNCEETVTGIFHEDTILPCNLTTTRPSKPTNIELTKDDGSNRLLFQFDENRNPWEAQNRIKLFSPVLKNVSLVLQKTQLSDSGKYLYSLETNVGYKKANIVLVVKAPYSLPKLDLVNLTETTKVVRCETTGYPSAQIHWSVNGKNLTFRSKTQKNSTAEGLISITSTLSIIMSETDQEHIYTCAVWNEAERKYEATNSMSINLTETTKVVRCETTGYPSAQIHWSVNGKNLTFESETQKNDTAEGLISITSTLSIIMSETDQEHIYTCAVWNEAERKYEVNNSISTFLKVSSPEPKEKKRIAHRAVSIIVGGLLAGIFLLGLLKFWRRRHPVRQFNEEAGNQMLRNLLLRFEDCPTNFELTSRNHHFVI